MKNCPNCGGPTAEGSFIANNGDFVLDAWRCLPCMVILSTADFDAPKPCEPEAEA